MDKKIRIGIIDIDDVLADFGSFIVEELNQLSGTQLTKEAYIHHDFYKFHDLPVSVMGDILRRESIYLRLKPLDKVVEGMYLLKEKGFALHIVTARGKSNSNIEEDTHQWFYDNNIPYDSIDFIDYHEKKSEYYLKYGNPEFVVDDRVYNLLDAQSVGVSTYCLKQPWNEYDINYKGPRVSNLLELADNF